MKQTRKLITQVVLFVGVFLPTFLFAATAADDLMGLGMSPQLADYISTKLVSLNSSGNIVLPVASGKKLSVTVAGTEELLVDGTNVTAATNNLVVTAGNITATAGNIAATAGTLTVGSTSTLTGAVTLPAGILNPTANEEAVAGAGTTVADAAALSATKHIHQITGANGTVGWKFPSLTVGQVEFLLNTTAGVPKVYAVSGGTCNGGATDAACTLVTGIAPHICWAAAANTLICS